MTILVLQPDASAGKDTQINQFTPNQNDDGLIDMQVERDSDESTSTRSMLQFDLSGIPVGATINSATLSVWVSFKGGSSPTTAIYRITSSWVENTVTWNNKPGFSTLISGSSAPPATGWHNFNILTAIQNWFSGAWSNFGMYLKLASESGLGRYTVYITSDFGTPANRPKLTIDYDPPSLNGLLLRGVGS